MMIETSPGAKTPRVYLWLTRAEARELRDSLDGLLDADDPERHEHVSSADFQTEITVVVKDD